jgi:hypothetical protein
MRKLINGITEAISDFFRMLLLKDYSKAETCRTVIINSIEKEKNEVDKFTIQAECKIRYYQVLAFWAFSRKGKRLKFVLFRIAIV